MKKGGWWSFFIGAALIYAFFSKDEPEKTPEPTTAYKPPVSKNYVEKKKPLPILQKPVRTVVRPETKLVNLSRPPVTTPRPVRQRVLFVTASRLNVRMYPTTSAQIIGSLNRHAQVYEIKRNGIWVHIRVPSSLVEGWVHGGYVSERKAVPRLERVRISPPPPIYRIPTRPSAASCCKICRKGKPCGNSCISRRYTCRRGPGCACAG